MIKVYVYGIHYVQKLKEVYKKLNLIKLFYKIMVKIWVYLELIYNILIKKVKLNFLYKFYVIQIEMILKSNYITYISFTREDFELF